MYSEKKDLQIRTNELSDTIHRNNIKTCKSIKAVNNERATASTKNKTNYTAARHVIV